MNQKKIFIVGNSRSGTTMMARLLDRNSRIFSFHELHFFEQLWFPTIDPKPLSENEAVNLSARLFTIQRDGYYNQQDLKKYDKEARQLIADSPGLYTPPHVFESFLMYETKRAGKFIPCDQTPRNVFYLKEIFSLYPEAYAINMIRDPRDVLLSQKAKWKRFRYGAKNIPSRQTFRFWANYHPISMSLMWKSGIEAALAIQGHSRLLNVHFEELIKCPEEKVKDICEFLGVPFEVEMLNVAQVGSSHSMDDKSTIGFDLNAIERWRNRDSESDDFVICEQINKSTMAQFGYVRSSYRLGLLKLVVFLMTWPMKLGLAFLLNMSRFQNLFSAVKRRFIK